MQRDIAFKIMYFFIVFIVATFGLLYAYFKMYQKEEQEAQRNKRAKGIFDEKDTRQTAFFDFLAGQMEDQEHYAVNPYATRNSFQSKMKPETAKQLAEHRQNASAGFGASNLENI